MAVICPTITAYNKEEYDVQLQKINSFASRIHIDVMDGIFTEKKSVELNLISWPDHLIVDIHLMAEKPMDYLDELLNKKPNMVIFQNEAQVHHTEMSDQLHKSGIKSGLALLQDTPVEWTHQIIHAFDQVLIFSGHLGYQGGIANLSLISKVNEVKTTHESAEIAWDGGINSTNVLELAKAGIDVLNVGSFIQNADDPQKAYTSLIESIRDLNG